MCSAELVLACDVIEEHTGTNLKIWLHSLDSCDQPLTKQNYSLYTVYTFENE